MARFRGLESGDREKWLVNLRWIAVAAIFIATFIAKRFFYQNILDKQIYIIALILLLLNIAYQICIRLDSKGKLNLGFYSSNFIIIVQIVNDLILLTLLLHFTGGVENPLIIYYIFHMIIASILLSRKISYLVTSFALGLVAALAFLECFEIIPHYDLEGFLKHGFYNDLNYIFGTGIVFLTTSYVVVYMTSTIASMLRKKELAFRDMNIKLLEKDQIKDDYVFRLSHDIKGHLSAIKNSLEAALVMDNPAKLKDFTQRALNRTSKLIDFVVNLLRITRLRMKHEMEVVPFSLEQAIRNVINLHQPFADNKQINLIAQLNDKGNLYMGNQFSFEEAISNLIHNAIKYTDEQGEVSVILKIKGHHYMIEINDTGIGISKDDVNQIFKEFYRAYNAKQKHIEGDGLGLSITKQIIKNHKGRIHAKNRHPKGASFIIELPVK